MRFDATLSYYKKHSLNGGYKIRAIIKTRAKTRAGIIAAVNRQTDFNMSIDEFNIEVKQGFVNFCNDGLVFLYD